jgi:asparagine synthase (glutamine-hydrolysing)
MCDAALLLSAWEQADLASLDHLLGDYAFGVWDFRESSLTLVRSPFALKPLFYHVNPRFLAFASMPTGLHALDAIPKQVNMEHAAAVSAEFTYLASSTIFKDVMLVRQGHAVRIKGGREQTLPIWSLDRDAQRFKNMEDYGEALRSELDRAVRAQLRRHNGLAASQLSSGRDSSAVTATAALVLKYEGAKLLALTGAPRAGFPGPSIAGKLADESVLAAKTSAFHDNIRHVICRPDGRSPFRQLKALNEVHHGPLLNPSALPWWSQVNEEASSNGATVLLFGSAGNFTISAGGVDQLRDLWIDKGMAAWLPLALRMGGLSPSSWRTIANVSLGPALPRGAYKMLLKATGRWSSTALQVPILRSPYRASAEDLLKREFSDPRPPRSFFGYRRDMLLKRDNPEKMSLARWGLDARDPTSDRRLVQLCFSLPVEQLVSAASARPAFDAAFGDRIPSEVLASRERGYQTADWFEIFRKEDVKASFDELGRNRLVRELLDLGYVGKLIDNWPTAGWDQRSIVYLYRNRLLGALALASYLDTHFPD